MTLANKSFTNTLGQVETNVKWLNQPNINYKLSFAVIDGCMQEIILGLPFLKLHSGVLIPFSGKRPILNLSSRKLFFWPKPS